MSARRVTSLPVELFKGQGRRYRSVLHRADGVTVELEGGSYNEVGGPHREVPHDLAHLVIEDELGLDWGVWGVLARGGLFRLAQVCGGRQPPHAGERARAIVREAGDRLNQAEIIVGAVCRLAAADDLDVVRLRQELGERWWSDSITAKPLECVRERLLEGARDWAQLDAEEALSLHWRPAH